MSAIQIAFIDLLPVLSTLFGLVFGSFLSVCIYRLPLGRKKGLASFEDDDDSDSLQPAPPADSSGERKISFFYPVRSFCPACNKMLLWWMNIPVISWVLLRGRCHHCKAGISWRYPLVELLSAVFCFLSFSLFPPATALLVYFFCAAMIVISFIDLEYYIIPNVITFPGMLLAIGLALINHYTHYFAFPFVGDLESAGLGLLMGGGFLWLVSALYRLARRREGLGFGDVKLMALVGLLFGPQAAIVGIFVGSTLGTIVGVIFIMFARSSFSRPLPFGPFLAIGSLLYIFLSPFLNFAVNPLIGF